MIGQTSKNYTYVKCDECVRHGTPRCRHKGERWGYCVIPGCMVLVECAAQFRKENNNEPAGT